jgi:hypothetical protein
VYDANLIVIFQNPASKKPEHNATTHHSKAIELGST